MVTIIILNFNGVKFIKKCLNSVFEINYPNYKVIFLDNCSTDESLSVVRDFNLDLKIIKLQRNMGYAAGNNIGAKYADENSKYLLFLNVDTEVAPSFLNNLVIAMESNLIFGAAQPKLLLAQDKSRIDSLGAFVDLIGTVYNIGGFEKDAGQYDQAMEIFYAKGAALIVKKQLFEKIFGFDERFFLWREEADLCWKIWLHGGKVLSVPSSVVYHHGSAIIKKTTTTPTMEFFFMRNNIRMMVKNYSLKNLLRYLPLFLIFRAFVTLHNVYVSKNVLYSNLFPKALFWNLMFLRETLLERKKVQNYVRRTKDDDIIGKVIIPKIFFVSELQKRIRQIDIFDISSKKRCESNVVEKKFTDQRS